MHSAGPNVHDPLSPVLSTAASAGHYRALRDLLAIPGLSYTQAELADTFATVLTNDLTPATFEICDTILALRSSSGADAFQLDRRLVLPSAGPTLLQVLATKGSVAKVRYLLRRGADPRIRGVPLLAALQNKHQAQAVTPLTAAVTTGRVFVVEAILDWYSARNRLEYYDQAALHAAVVLGRTDCLNALAHYNPRLTGTLATLQGAVESAQVGVIDWWWGRFRAEAEEHSANFFTALSTSVVRNNAQLLHWRQHSSSYFPPAPRSFKERRAFLEEQTRANTLLDFDRAGTRRVVKHLLNASSGSYTGKMLTSLPEDVALHIDSFLPLATVAHCTGQEPWMWVHRTLAFPAAREWGRNRQVWSSATKGRLYSRHPATLLHASDDWE
jgi:hypothetical protein